MAALGYTQLDRSKKTIRLLTVAPSDPEEQIRCELTHADLDESPSFIALSYTWDQGGGQDEIECCGTTIQIGKNLRNFLYRFRIWDEGRGSRLWIDALCINQNDVHERNHQVGQMRALYSTATSTIAWLGEADGNSDLVYSTILSSAARQSLGPSNDETRRALTDFLNRKYWSRVWVIQEFLLPMDLDVWWGTCRVKVSDLRRIVWTIAELPSISGSKLRDPLIWDTPGKVLLLYRMNYQTMRSFDNYDTCKAFADSMTLPSLLQSFSSSQCTLIHDGVYALLGIASDVLHSSDPILPDYTKPLIELCLDVLRNQYGGEVPEATHAWSLIDTLCNVLKLNCQEIEQFTLVRARKVKRESHLLDIRNLSVMPSDWWFHILLRAPDQSLTTRKLQWMISAMGRETGCLVALRDYLDYSKSHKKLVQGPVKSLLGKNKAPVDTAFIRAWADISGLKMVASNYEREKLRGEYSPHDSLVKSIKRQLHDEGWSAFSEIELSGVIRTVTGGSEDIGARTRKGHKAQVASYYWFGKYGAAIVLECRCERYRYRCHSPDWHVVGTAFFCKSPWYDEDIF